MFGHKNNLTAEKRKSKTSLPISTEMISYVVSPEATDSLDVPTHGMGKKTQRLAKVGVCMFKIIPNSFLLKHCIIISLLLWFYAIYKIEF